MADFELAVRGRGRTIKISAPQLLPHHWAFVGIEGGHAPVRHGSVDPFGHNELQGTCKTQQDAGFECLSGLRIQGWEPGACARCLPNLALHLPSIRP